MSWIVTMSWMESLEYFIWRETDIFDDELTIPCWEERSEDSGYQRGRGTACDKAGHSP